MVYRLTGVLTLAVAFACTPAAKFPQSKSLPRTAPKAPIAAPTQSDVPDDSSFTQRAGQTKRVKLPDTMAAAIGRLTTPKATYLRLRANAGIPIKASLIQSVVDASGRPLSAATHSESSGPGLLESQGEYELLIRLPSDIAKDELKSVHWTARRLPSSNTVAGGYEQTLSIPTLDSAPIQADLERRFGEAMAGWFNFRSDGNPFMSFARGRIIQRFAKPADKKPMNAWQSRSERTDLARLMDFYTGRSSVRDSLQSDRGLQLSSKTGPLTVDPATIHVDAPSERDYEQLVEKSMPANVPVLSPLAQALPADVLVIEFATLRDMIQLPRLIDERLGSILRVAEGAGGSNHLIERYRTQLGVELDGFAETVGQFAVRSIAVVLGDTYLREGTDLTLVFRAENPALLETVLANHLARAKSRNPNIVTTSETIAGETVNVNSSPDGAMRRYEFGYGDLRILSNSRAGISRLVQAKRGKVAKLSDDKGYLGARRLAPYDSKQERAFVFFGDAFVANVIGPRARILESRRMRAQSELEAADNLALLYGWFEGKPAKAKADLLESGWAAKSDFVHADGAPIDWTPAKGAHSRWGYAKSLVPIADLPFDKISADEATAYRSFRDWYNAALNGRLDPTSFRLLRAPNDQGLSTELRVFPIMPNGTFQREFREIARMVGDGRVEPGQKTRGATVTLGVGEGSPLRELSDDFIRHSLGTSDIKVGFVGDWVQAGWDEGSALWDIAGQEHEILNLGTDEQSHERLNFDALLPKLPLWIGLHVKSRLLLAAALTAVRAQVEKAAEGLVKWEKDSPYRSVPVTRIQAKENDEPEAIRVNVYYATANNVFLVSLRREILQARIDDVLDGRSPKGSSLPQGPSQFVLDLSPRVDGWQQRTAQGWLDKAALLAHERACTGLEVLERGFGNLPREPESRRQVALRLLGYEPESPQSGEIVWRDGLCEHPVYGTAVEPKVPDAKDPQVPLHRSLSAMQALRFTLGLIPRGGASELWSHFELEPRQ
jgi:hypothetical protein